MNLGKLVCGKIANISRKRPTQEECADTSKSQTHDEATNTWKCNFCGREGFTVDQILDHHVDFVPAGGRMVAKHCPGEPVGIRIRFENGLIGFVEKKNISDNTELSDPFDRIKVKNFLHNLC